VYAGTALSAFGHVVDAIPDASVAVHESVID
jgi:hypothetical protein